LGDLVEYEYVNSGTVVIIRLNRPNKLNALNTELTRALAEAFARFEQSNALVAVLTGVGRSFTTGMDVQESIDAGLKTVERPDLGSLYNPFWPGRPDGGSFVRTLDKPVISAINGFAFGGGYYLAMAADICIAAETATFEISEIQRGMLAGWDQGPLEGLPRHMSMELAMGGRLTARRAYEVGLINEVVPDTELLSAAIRWGDHISSLSQAVIRANRSLVDEARTPIATNVVKTAARYERDILDLPDVSDGLRLFSDRD
jgi:enoyl-CoA hydratase/carnithine racemase